MRFWWKAALCLGAGLFLPGREGRSDEPAKPAPRDATAIAAVIDREVNRSLAQEKTPASGQADDAEFCRRCRRRVEDLEGREQISKRVPHGLEDERGSVVLRPVEILTGKLSGPCGDAVIRPSLLNPPGIEAECVLTGHAAWAREQPEVGVQVSSGLPESCRVKIPTRVIVELPEIDVDRPADTVPAKEFVALLTLDVRE